MHTIHICSKRKRARGSYVGRPSPLGNPFELQRERDRPLVISQYGGWLQEQIAQRTPEVMAELDRLLTELRQNKVLYLTCWCAPKACHAEHIAMYLMQQLHAEGEEACLYYQD